MFRFNFSKLALISLIANQEFIFVTFKVKIRPTI